jgi:superfamily II DNA or RNA helicase
MAQVYLQPNRLATWDTGTGKSYLAIGSASLLIEDGRIDHIVVAAELSKLEDWTDDFRAFTSLSVGVFHGSKRMQLLDSLPQVIVGTWETLKTALATRHKVRRYKEEWQLEPLTLALAGKRVLVIGDEAIVKLRNRGSGIYGSYERALGHWRKHGEGYFLALTATPVESSIEQAFNLMRLVAPGFLRVADFESNYVMARDLYDRIVSYKNISEEDNWQPGVEPFSRLISPWLLRKRKTDPDIAHLFPKVAERFEHISLTPAQDRFVEAITDLYDGARSGEQAHLFTILRQIAGHPMSLAYSEGELGQSLAAQMGPLLETVGSAKTDRLVEVVTQKVAEGRQVVVFTFFGQSVLPLLQEALEGAGMTVVANHGKMTGKARRKAETTFRSGQAQVFLSSDAGARGINLPEATFLINYELPLTFANYVQRINRISRINSTATEVEVLSFIADQTVEQSIAEMFAQRNRWHDTVLDDTDDGSDWISADERTRLIKRAADMNRLCPIGEQA